MTRLPITPRPALNNNSRRPTAARPASLGLLMHSSVAGPNQLRSYLRLQRVEAISSAIDETSKKPSQKPLKPFTAIEEPFDVLYYKPSQKLLKLSNSF